MSYALKDLPRYDASKTIEEFRRVVIDREMLHALDEDDRDMYRLYLLADGAVDKSIDQHIEIYRPDHRSIYPKAYGLEVDYAQPFLIDTHSSREFLEWFMQDGYGNYRGIYIWSRDSIDGLSSRLQAFCIGHMTEGHKETFFRFYDPRILPAFIKMLSIYQAIHLFGDGDFYIAENYISADQMDIYGYSDTEHAVWIHKHDLLSRSTPLLARDTMFSKPKESQEDGLGLLFDKYAIMLLTHHKEALFAKQVCLSLMEQMEHLSDTKCFKEIYNAVLKLIDTGVREYGLTDKDTLYLWSVANILHPQIPKILKEYPKYTRDFMPGSEVSQNHKKTILKELIAQIEKQKMRGKK